MKIYLKFLTPLLLTAALVGCAGTSASTQETDDRKPATAVSSTGKADAASSDDHHKGETNVQPHDDSAAVPADHIDDPNEPPHGHSSSHDDSNRPPHRD